MRNLLWCLLLIGFVLNADVSAQSELDTTFASTGKAVLSGALAGARDVVVQPDNKIVMISNCSTMSGSFAFCAVRLNENGSYDTNFGGGPLPPPGYLLDSMGAGSGQGGARGVALQNDGKLVLVGYANQTLAMARFNPDGSLDASFGSGGKVFTDVTPDSPDRANKVVIQPDGKILVVGFSGSAYGQLFVARYAADGMLDASFGTGGIARTIIPDHLTAGISIELQPDGKILAGGNMLSTAGSSGFYLLARLNPDGSPDATWDGDGVTSFSYGTPSFPDAGFLSVEIQSDGRVLALGHGNIIYRFNPNGSLDTGFDGDGTRPALPVALNDEAPYDLILSAGGKITVVGHSRPGPTFSHQYAVARYQPNGAPDLSFSADGYLDIDMGGGPSSARAVASDSQGRIVVAGTRGLGQIPDPLGPGVFSVARLLAPVVSVAISGRADFDGDVRTDISVFRPGEGNWYITNSSNNAFRAEHFGAIGDVIAPGDYDGDGKTDDAVFRPSSGYWYILNSSDNSVRSAQLGQAGDIPATGDFDGDGKSDIVVFRPSAGTFYLLHSSDGSSHSTQWGADGDIPVMGDYDGDSKTDFAIFRPSGSAFYILRSSDGSILGQQWGTNGDKAITADFDGDRKTDIAVYRPSTGAWYYLQSSDNGFRGVGWGVNGDIPVAGDYDGDGKSDVAIFRPSVGVFYILQSTNSSLRAEQFGANGDVPVAGAFVH